MSDEISHGKTYLVRGRLSDVKELPDPEQTAEERSRIGRDVLGRAAVGNQLALRSYEKNMITRRERAALDREFKKADPGATPNERADMLRQVLRMYNAARRDHPAETPAVLSATLSFARGHVVAAVLFERATEAGLGTDLGMLYLDLAQKAEARSERAALQATTLAHKAASKPDKVIDVHAAVLEHFGRKS